jgi:prepilin peptidase CpaA
MNRLALLNNLPLLALMMWAAIVDLRERRIPNWLTFGLILAGLARTALAPWPMQELANAALGMLAGAAIPLVLFILGALGGGDVKLMAAIGVWLGAREAIVIFVIECLVGAVLVLIQAIVQGRLMRLLRNSAVLATSISQQGVGSSAELGSQCRSVDRPLPFAVPTLIATLMVMTLGPALI